MASGLVVGVGVQIERGRARGMTFEQRRGPCVVMKRLDLVGGVGSAPREPPGSWSGVGAMVRSWLLILRVFCQVQVSEGSNE